MSKRKTTRRQFLRGQSAVDALGDLTHGGASSGATGPGSEYQASGEKSSTAASSGDEPTRSYLLHVARRAMACDFQIYLNAGEHPGAVEQAVKALDLVERLEEQMTVYREDSEIQEINRGASDGPRPVEPRLYGLLRMAATISAETDGAFDVTAGPLSRLWGFHRREGRVPAPAELERTLECVGSHRLEFDDVARTIRFRRAGMELNLGGIGKGYALDRCGQRMRDEGVTDFLIHGGHSSVLAAGSRRSSDARPGWTVAVRHPLLTERRLLEVRLRDRALGTSGAAKQFFHHQGRRLGHVLDPRTGWPAEGVLSATVIAEDAATADALATAFYVMGIESARRYCSRHDDVGAILVLPGSRVGAVEVVALGMDDDDWRRS